MSMKPTAYIPFQEDVFKYICYINRVQTNPKENKSHIKQFEASEDAVWVDAQSTSQK